MDVSNVCPTEDAIQVFLEYLVEPMLPAKNLTRGTPTLDKQKAVAKQVHAVVLLYNYYHRKRHSQLEYLGFETFCKLALVVKPNLKSYMKLMLRSDDSESSDLEKQLSVTEKAIKDACHISRSLDASRDVPSTMGWPVSKVAVLLIELMKENCFLQHGSLAEGVWSVIEKDVYVSSCISDEVRKRKRIPNEPLQDELLADESHFQQVAFSAVKEATNNGISQSDLTIIESHFVYSLSKEKTAACFYIMQCTHSEKSNGVWIPIKYVIDSLQGSLVKKSTYQWTHSSVVEYFHLLPYGQIISQWFSRDKFPDSLQDQESVPEVVNVGGSGLTEKPCEPEVYNNRNKNQIGGGLVEAFKNNPNAESEKQNEKNKHCTPNGGPLNRDVNNHCMIYSEKMLTSKNEKNNPNAKSEKQNEKNKHCTPNGGPLNRDVNNHCVICCEKMSRSKTVAEKVQHDAQLRMLKSCAESNFNGTTNVAKFEVVDSTVQNINDHKGQNVSSKKAAWKNMPCQDVVPLGNHAPVIHESNSKNSAKLLRAIASKEHMLSETALRVLQSKREKLILQQRNIGDEIAQCDKKIQTIINGEEDAFELKIDLIIEGCTDVCLRSASQGRASHDYEDQGSTKNIKGNRWSKEAFRPQDPCQELDGICNENNWILPTYHVFPSDGGYQAKVTVKGINFESSSVGNACPKPLEARGSAAAQMLAKLHNMSTPPTH